MTYTQGFCLYAAAATIVTIVCFHVCTSWIPKSIWVFNIAFALYFADRSRNWK